MIMGLLLGAKGQGGTVICFLSREGFKSKAVPSSKFKNGRQKE